MIDIVLPAFNGEAFLPEQLNSLLNQTETGWRLLAMDDGSADGSAAILVRYAAQYPEKIVLLPNASPSGSAAAAFLRLISRTDAPYVMCCDQDDFWYADKLRLTLEKMKELEEKRGRDTPLLVHTDLAVTDAGLNLLSPSFVRSQRLNPGVTAFGRLLAQNNVTGCTVMINAALRSLLPPDALPSLAMHDWWMALVAAAFGEIGYIDVATVSYRQHGGNAVGAKAVGSLRYQFDRLTQSDGIRHSMLRTYRQAEAFQELYHDMLPKDLRRLVSSYAMIPERGKLGRLIILLKGNFFKQDLRRAIGQLLFV